MYIYKLRDVISITQDNLFTKKDSKWQIRG